MERTEVLHKDRPAGPLQDQNIGFEDYLYNWAMFIDQEQRYTRDLTQAAVTMHVRSRGVTISDMVSGYGTRVETQGRWLQYDPNLDGEVHPINIVGPNLNTNKNACLQSNAATEVTSANASAKNKQIAMRWQKIADYFERTGWNESKRGIIFDNVQKSGTILIDTFLKEIDRQIITRITDEEKSIALYSCESCGEAGLTDAPKEVAITEGVDRSPENVTPPAVVDNDNDAESEPDGDADDLSTLGKAAMITCPDCGADAHAVITTDAMMRQGETDVPVYDIADSVIPFFNYAIDGYGAKTEGIQGAGWLQGRDFAT